MAALSSTRWKRPSMRRQNSRKADSATWKPPEWRFAMREPPQSGCRPSYRHFVRSENDQCASSHRNLPGSTARLTAVQKPVQSFASAFSLKTRTARRNANK